MERKSRLAVGPLSSLSPQSRFAAAGATRNDTPDAMRSAPTTTAARSTPLRWPSMRFPSPAGTLTGPRRTMAFGAGHRRVRCQNRDSPRGRAALDATVAAVPAYFGTMGAERWWLARRAERDGPSAADYERRDTITSLTMGVASLLAPMIVPKLLAPITPGKGRFGKALVATAIGAVAVTTIADVVARFAEAAADQGAMGNATDDTLDLTDPEDVMPPDDGGALRGNAARLARKIASV